VPSWAVEAVPELVGVTLNVIGTEAPSQRMTGDPWREWKRQRPWSSRLARTPVGGGHLWVRPLPTSPGHSPGRHRPHLKQLRRLPGREGAEGRWPRAFL